MFPWHFSFFLFYTNHSLFLYSSSLALPSLLSSQVIPSSVATFALFNGPSRNLVRLGVLCLLSIMGEESHEISNSVLGWKKQGPWHSKLGSTFEFCSLKPSSFWPKGMWGGLHEVDAVKLPLVACKSVVESWWQWALQWKQGEVCMLSDPSIAMNQTQSKTLELITT